MKKSLKILAGVFTIATLPLSALASPIDPPIIEIPDFPPFLAVVDQVPAQTYDATPDFAFSSTEAGTIIYEGDCSSTTTAAIDGDNTVTFKTLALGVHDNCKVKVKGTSTGLTSAALDVPAFEVKLMIVLPPLDLVAPKLSLVSGIPSTTEDHTPSFTFNTDEAGTIAYEGACVSSDTTAALGENTIVFNNLSAGTYSNCKINVTDAASNKSTSLAIPEFTVIETLLPPAVALCADFKDVTTSDSDCDAIVYVKSLGAMTGNPDGTFGPDDLLQRDQIAKIALVTFKKFDPLIDYCAGKTAFPDVVEASWSYQYVCRAKLLSLVTGYASGVDKGFFRPARNVIRVEFLAILLRNLSESMPEGSSYSDVGTGDWFNKYAKFSYDNSLFAGAKLSPSNFTTRREVARVIYKLHLLGKI